MIESEEIKHRLTLVNQVPTPGIVDLIDVPQLVVCGDQSSGKSSVLEAITGIPFPRKDGGCTRFATEIVFRHADSEWCITAAILPHPARDDAEKSDLRAQSWTLSKYDEVPGVIEEVARVLKLRGCSGEAEGGDAPTDGDANANTNGNTKSNANLRNSVASSQRDNPSVPFYAPDVLRIEVVGDTGLHLRIVDLPGIVPVTAEGKAGGHRLIKKLVDTYLENSNSVILAVMPADSDIESQPVIQRALYFDGLGERTIGVLTKPDLIPRRGEDAVIRQLRADGSVNLELGYFLLKNPDSKGLENGVTASERKEKELEYFQSPGWVNLWSDMSRVGAEALRISIATLLEDHMEKELPKVQSEIGRVLTNTREQLEMLGTPRSNIAEQRLFLSELGTTFTEVVQSALDGRYWNSSFFAEEKRGIFHNRIRAHIHRLNISFSEYMRDRSHKRQLRIKDSLATSSAASKPSSPGGDKSRRSSMDVNESHGLGHGHAHGHLAALGSPLIVSKDEWMGWITSVYRQMRRPELPGNWNHALLMALFNTQSSRWQSIGEQHAKTVHKKVTDFVDRVLFHVVKEDHVRIEIRKIITPLLRANLDAALEELGKIVRDEATQPISYHYYLTDNANNARQDRMRDVLRRAFHGGDKSYLDTASEERSKIIRSGQMDVNIEMDREACEEASTALSAYYKVAMSTFVDNVCRQVVERHLVGKLPGVFNVSEVLKFSDEEIERIATEPAGKMERRADLTEQVRLLSDSLGDLQS